VAHQAQGASLTYEEDAAVATTELRRAVRHWTDADAPFEAAQARRWLAVAYGRAATRRRRRTVSNGPMSFPTANQRDVELKGLADPVPLVSIDWS
jgi:hypothetical protein